MVAGEASGDLHAASLARELKSLLPQTEILGMGGERMAEVGVRLLAHCSSSSVVGSVEAVGMLGSLFRSFCVLRTALASETPNLLVLIDFPDFNLLLARVAKKRGIPIVYYISPQIWAWRGGRLRTMRRLVDLVLVILPFEEEIFRQARMEAHFVGHPLLDLVKPSLSREEVRSRLGITRERTLIGLMPGSRLMEVRRHLPLMLESADLLTQRHPKLCFVVSQAETVEDAELDGFLSQRHSKWRVWKGRPYDLMNACDFLLVASGTVTLEAGLLGIPMVIIYRLSWFSALVGRRLMRVPNLGLINLLLGREVAPELLQGRADPRRIAQVIDGYLQEPERREAMRRDLLSVRSRLGEPGASRRAALHIVRFLEAGPHSRPESR